MLETIMWLFLFSIIFEFFIFSKIKIDKQLSQTIISFQDQWVKIKE